MYQNLFIIACILFIILKDFVKLFYNCGPELDKNVFIEL